MLVAAVIITAAAILAACGGGQYAAGASSTSASTPASPCSGDNLSISQANGMLYSFHDLFVYALKNMSSSDCSLTGYPQLASATESGSKLAANFDDTTESPVYEGASTQAVTLQPGDSAGLYIGSVGDPGGPDECTAAERVHGTVDITVTGGGSPLTIPSNNCPGQTIYVSPFQPSPALPQIPGTTDTNPAPTTTSSQ